MARTVPKEEREKIVKAFKLGLGSAKELASIFGLHSRTVSKYVKQERDTGDLTPQTQPGRPRVITEEILEHIKNLVLSNPDYTLQEYADALYKETKVNVTAVSIHNACKRLNLRRKKKLLRLRTRPRGHKRKES